MTRIASVLVLVGLLFAAPVWAQTPVESPSSVTWDHSDYATAASYTFGYFLLPVNPDGTCNVSAQPAAQPYMVDTLPKPATTDGLGMSGTLVARPIGCYIAKLRAVDQSGLLSAWSDPTVPFIFRPAAPVPRAIK